MSTATMVPTLSETKHDPATTDGAPIVLDLGKQRRKAVRRLRRGTGKLMEEVTAAIEELRAAGAVAAGAQPVIVVVQLKRKKVSGYFPNF